MSQISYFKVSVSYKAKYVFEKLVINIYAQVHKNYFEMIMQSFLLSLILSNLRIGKNEFWNGFVVSHRFCDQDEFDFFIIKRNWKLRYRLFVECNIIVRLCTTQNEIFILRSIALTWWLNSVLQKVVLFVKKWFIMQRLVMVRLNKYFRKSKC